ncbi:MAG: META domain-containing protein [Anaerolineales bacterium]
MKKYLLILFLLSLALSACASATNTPANTPSLIGTWKLTAYGPADSPTPAVADVDANLKFDADGKVGGSGGCNSLGGDYTVEGDQIKFGPIVSTMMACEEPRMTQEAMVAQVMTESVSYKIDGNTLTISKDGNVLVFKSVAGK